MSRRHELKVWPEYFGPIAHRRKTFEIRKNDRNYMVGDTLILKEWNPDNGLYTDNWCTRTVKYIVRGGQFGIADDYCVMGIE